MALVSGAGSSFDFESRSSVSVRASVFDGVHTLESVFVISVSDVDEAPSGIGREPLMEHYAALLQERAIYYPVAYTFELLSFRQALTLQVILARRHHFSHV